MHIGGGEAIADAIPGAEPTIFPTMGHDVPGEAWPEIRSLKTARFSRSDS